MYKRLAGDDSHPDLPFAGLVHDLARPLNDVYHGEIIAEVVRDRVDALTYTILRTHGAFQDALMHGGDFPVLPDEGHLKYAMLFCRCEEESFIRARDVPSISYDHALTMIYNYLD